MSGAVKSVSWNNNPGRVERDESRHRVLSEVARPSALAPFRHPELPLPVARRPAHVLGVRDGDAHSRLVRAGRDRIGAAADRVCVAQLHRHADCPDVRRDRRPHRSPRPARDDAGDLCGARRHADDAGADRPSEPALCLHHRGDHGSRSTVGSRRARRAGRHHHAARSIDRRDQPVANHDGHGAHRRRAERRRAVRRARDRAGLCGDRQPLRRRHAADPVRRGAVDAASGRCNG